jgi:hypothetical protein
MRVMNLPDLSIVDSLEFANGLHASRLKRALAHPNEHVVGLHPPLQASPFLVAYMAWPNDANKREQWMAATIARYLTDHRERSEPLSIFHSFGGLRAISDPAFNAIADDLSSIEMGWQAAADIFGRLIDMAAEKGLQLRGGPSIAKAIGLCELDKTYKRAQFERFWTRFRDVAHLITAAAVLAEPQNGLGRSIFLSAWLSPDAVIGIADAYEDFGLRNKSHGAADTILPSKTTWRMPEYYCKKDPFFVKRRLSDEQRSFLERRKSRKSYISKPR